MTDLSTDQLADLAVTLAWMQHCDRCGKRMGEREGRLIRGRIICKRCRLEAA